VERLIGMTAEQLIGLRGIRTRRSTIVSDCQQKEGEMEPFDRYADGGLLYGDNFTQEEIDEWAADEAEAYASLGAADRETYTYAYHALNQLHGFRHLPPVRFPGVLAFGGAYGDELMPLICRVQSVTVIDPSTAFTSQEIAGVPIARMKPGHSGRIGLPEGMFDVVTCLGVLHHIPNVSFVLAELGRVLKPGGYMLLREPVISMGDWSATRPGLTKRERGIPVKLLEVALSNARLEVVHKSLCQFPLTRRLARVRPIPGTRRMACEGDGAYNSRYLCWLDAMMCRLFAWNLKYHGRTALQKLRPTSVFYVLQKVNRPGFNGDSFV
jgi:SAM-dependent methyltransferase